MCFNRGPLKGVAAIIVINNDFIVFNQMFANVGGDKAGAAGDKDFFVFDGFQRGHFSDGKVIKNLVEL